MLSSCVAGLPADLLPAELADKRSDQHVIEDINAVALADLTADIERAAPGEFELYFNSPGGSVFDGLDFIRVMERAQARGVTFICTADFAASMGAVIFSACDVRLALPRAVIMIHSASAATRGTADEHRELASALEAISDAMFRQMARVMVISFEELKARAGSKDYWLDSERAYEIGLVQAILP